MSLSSMLSLLVGLPIILWSWRLWRQPDLLEPESLMYRVFYAYSRIWSVKEKKTGKVTVREIKRYAMMNLVLGILLIAVGIVEIVW